ncbi:MAG: alpha/beta hydrolase [Candidatus Wallbacteria bacterium]|nr:alpha/beta hydrolase [Candidatus Wallbacteria bacterium]
MKISIKRIIRSIVEIIVVTYLISACFLYFFQDKLLFLTTREMYSTTPAIHGIEYKDVYFKTKDGLKLHGWFITGKSENPYLLFCHGNAENVSGLLESALQFYQLGLNVLFFDYRCYGKSEGKTISETGTYLDAEAAWDFMVNELKIPSDKIIIFGRSLGGAVATKLASERTCEALIVESGFYSATERAAELYKWYPIKWMIRNPYESGKNLRSIKCPVLIIHSPDDEIIPFHHGQELFAAANEPKRFLTLKGDHNNGYWIYQEIYLAGIKQFLVEFNLMNFRAAGR